jgi:hypothetical protein
MFGDEARARAQAGYTDKLIGLDPPDVIPFEDAWLDVLEVVRLAHGR